MNPVDQPVDAARVEFRELKAAAMDREPLSRFRVILEHLSALWRALLIGIVLGLILAFVIPTQYEATVSLMPPENRNEGAALLLGLASGGSGGLGSMAGDVLGTNRGGAVFIGILRSRTVQEQMVDRFNLREVYRDKYLTDAVEDLNARTFVNEDRKSGIIIVTVRDRSPLRAANMAQSYVSLLDRVVTEVSTSSARRERVFLEERLKKVKQDLDSAAVEFSEFASRNAALDITEQGKAMMEGIARLTGELIAAESELKGLQQIYNPNNVRVRTLQARVNELRAQVDKMGGASDDSKQTSPGSYPSLRRLPLLGVKYADLYRRAKTQEVIYEILTKQYELSKVQEAKEIPTVRVLDKARIPERKVFPSRLLVLVVTVLMTTLGTTLFLLIRHEWAMTNPGNPWKMLAIEVFERMQRSRFWVRKRTPETFFTP